MAWMMLAIASHPDIQKKAQIEIDRVIGRDRMPTFQDIPQLPYLSALVTEILRWRGIGPLGVPHRSNADDYYEGFFIPKDTIVIANVWALNHDAEVWGFDADKFRPERHLDETGQLKKPLPDTHGESHVTFGYGRRICVGKAVAQNNLLIQTACILWTTSVSLPKDNSGKTITPDPFAWVESGLIFRPQPFSLEISPQLPGIEDIVAGTLDAKGIEV
ncbi:hypothetical protein AAF712_012945 [Marasmius tenuissimus]|uniref:Cytochrome P450 n=1 Tax=Marasmius tenuissimus TaxID=585030 RepID=A0ABR2ZIM1_9AGAR